jgi:ADP-heptose:LPS heptosyltransferase
MHLLTLSASVDLGPLDQIPPGEYAVEDVAAAQLLVLAGGGRMAPFVTEVERSALFGGQDYNGKSILLVRAGGFGDLVLLTPVLREIKRRWPAAKVRVSTMRHYAPVLSNLPFVDEVLPYPVPVGVVNECAAVVFYENAIEHNPRAEELHATELFGEIAGLLEIADLKPEYRVRPSEAVWANEAYPRVNGTRRVCIQVGASAALRVYPQKQMGEVVGALLKRGWEVFLMGDKGEVKLPDATPPGLRNLAAAGLTFRQSCAVVSQADVLIGNDSALVHVAGALDVPAVAPYGPFPWKLRTAYSPSVHAIQGNAGCDPCFHHVNVARRNHFPDHCPSKKRGICQVLESIKPDRIVALAEKVARVRGGLGDGVISVGGR